jgi:Do/DeqQ family serine protease
MPLDTPSLRAILAVGVLTLAFGGAASLVLKPERASLGAQPELVRAPPRPVSAEAVRPAAELGEAFIAISEAVTPAVVRIEAEQKSDGRPPSLGRRLQDLLGGQPEDSANVAEPEIAGGSGFIVSADGYILTNHHVIHGASRISVALADKRTFTAQVVGSDPLTDVAVIRIPATNLPAVPLGDSDSTRVGQWVLAIGNPGFDGANTLDFTVTGGIISAKGRGLQVLAVDEPAQEEQETLIIEDFMQTDAVINPGNSGGPLVNLQGAVIGINTAIASTTGSYQGYGFAIPSNLVRRVMRDLVQYGFMRRALLGVSIRDVSADDAEVYGLPRIAGVLVEDFGEESVAEQAGVKRHDVITAVDGRAVDRVGQLQQLIAQHDPGDEVLLTVHRFGKQLQYRMRLQEANRRAIPTAAPAAAAAAAGIGIEVLDLDAPLAQRHGFEHAGGAVIARVLAGSAASQADVIEGRRILSIDQRPVSDAREARRLLRAARPGHVLSLLLQAASGETYIANLRVP